MTIEAARMDGWIALCKEVVGDPGKTLAEAGLSLVLRGNKKRMESGRTLLSESAGRFEDGCRRHGSEKKNELGLAWESRS
jgi:hypothetical protein